MLPTRLCGSFSSGTCGPFSPGNRGFIGNEIRRKLRMLRGLGFHRNRWLHSTGICTIAAKINERFAQSEFSVNAKSPMRSPTTALESHGRKAGFSSKWTVATQHCVERAKELIRRTAMSLLP